MKQSIIYQSALIISVLVTGALALSRLDPFYNTLGIIVPSVSFWVDLWFVWLFLAIFRNVKMPKWVHYVLLIIPLCFFILTFDGFSDLWKDHHYGIRRPKIPIKIFAYALIIPLIGIRPSCGKSIKCDIIVFALSFISWNVTRVLTSSIAYSHGFGVDFYECSPLIFTCYISRIVVSWSLISLSCRDEVKSVYDRKWVKLACVSFCVLATIFIFVMPENYRLTYEGLSWVYPIPVFWYLAYCVFRFFKKVFSKNMTWKAVVFDK